MTSTPPALLPGLDDGLVVQRLQDAAVAFTNIRSSSGDVAELWARYIAEAAERAEMLAAVLRPAAVETLLFSRSYDRIVGIYPAAAVNFRTNDAARRGLSRLLDAEITRVSDTLTNLATAVRKAREPLSRRDELYLIPDTNVLVSRPSRPHGENLGTVPWLDLLDPELYVQPPGIVRLLLPLLVLDETDNLKRNGPNRSVKDAAREVLRDLNGRLAGRNHERPLVLDRGDRDTRRPALALELLFDPPGHRRLPRPDDEIVAVARDQHALRGRSVDVLTCDLNFATRARRFETRSSDRTELRVHLLRSSYDPAPT